MQKSKKIFLGIVIALFFVSVVGFDQPVKALTVSEISTLIEQIKAQIAQLQAQLTQMLAQQQGTTQTWCHTFNRNLKIGATSQPGDTGDEIYDLQTALEKEGFGYAKKDNANAGSGGMIFGENTASAVVEFQERYASDILTPSGLRRGTGYVGPATRKKLNTLYGCVSTPINQTIQPWQIPGGKNIDDCIMYNLLDMQNCYNKHCIKLNPELNKQLFIGKTIYDASANGTVWEFINNDTVTINRGHAVDDPAIPTQYKSWNIENGQLIIKDSTTFKNFIFFDCSNGKTEGIAFSSFWRDDGGGYKEHIVEYRIREK